MLQKNYLLLCVLLLLFACANNNKQIFKIEPLANTDPQKKSLTALSFRTPLVQQQIFAGGDSSAYNTLLNIYNPILLVTDQSNYNDYKYSSSLCNVINSSFSDITCILYVTQGKNKTNLIKKEYYYGNQNNSSVAIADLTIMKIDEYAKYLETKKITDVPLDIVTYLHGEYFFMFTNAKNPNFMIEQFNQGNARDINVVAFNKESEEYFTKFISPILNKKRIKINVMAENNPNYTKFINTSLCKPSSYDLFVYFGDALPRTILDIIENCSTSIQPVGFSDENLLNIEKTSNQLSIANVSSYFPGSSTSVFLSKYLEFAKANSVEITDEEINGKPFNLKENIDKKDMDNTSLPIIAEKNITRKEEKRKVYGIIASETNLFSEINSTHQKLYFDSSAAIRTFGIRYVLLASRYTKKEFTISILDALYKDYDILRHNYITNDIIKYTIKDMILGTSSKPVGLYHVGVYYYPRALLLSKNKKTEFQDELIKVIASNIGQTSVPKAFGPADPTYEQINIIAEKSKNLAQRRKEFSVIQMLQREVFEIEKSIEILRRTNLQEIDTESVGSSLSREPIKPTEQSAIINPITTNAPTVTTEVTLNNN